MSGSPTLHSRLRVLVAKTFRAEKLYGAVRNSGNAKESELSLSSFSSLTNDIRAKEWQRCHNQFRSALNELLSPSFKGALGRDATIVENKFRSRAQVNAEVVQKGVPVLVECAKREEFARVFKLVIELMQHKARAQAYEVLADELSASLQASGRSTKLKSDPEGLAMNDSLDEIFEAALGTGDRAPRKDIEPQYGANVIPLRRKAGSK